MPWTATISVPMGPRNSAQKNAAIVERLLLDAMTHAAIMLTSQMSSPTVDSLLFATMVATQVCRYNAPRFPNGEWNPKGHHIVLKM